MVWNNDSTYLFHIYSGKPTGNTGVFNQSAAYPADINCSTTIGNAWIFHRMSYENRLSGRWGAAFDD